MNKKGNVIVFFILGLVILAVLFYGVWMWGFCRFYVPPDHMAVIIAKSGKPLPPGNILAERGEKGVWKDVLGEGRYFLNPVFFEQEIQPVIRIDVGKIGVVTSKVGENLPPGKFLANPGQKGIQKNVLGPGKYRINPYGYNITIHDALQIPIGYVGVVTSLAGDEAKQGEFAEIGQKGVMENVLQPGLYYINPKQYKVDILEIGTNQISLLGSWDVFPGSAQREVLRTKSRSNVAGNLVVESQALQDKFELTEQKQQMYKKTLFEKKNAPAKPQSQRQRLSESAISHSPIIQYVEFPSKDGFDIRIDLTVEFEFLPKDIALIFMKYGDLFQVVEKVILPQILSISRLQGSAYGAKDFIVGEGREKFQETLFDKLQATLGLKGIKMLTAIIRNVVVPNEIREPIQDASIAIERNLTNIEKQETAKKRAELNMELSLIDQLSEKVQQETEKMKAEIKASEEKDVAEIHATTLKLVSEIEKKTAGIQAEIRRKLGKAKSEVIRMVGQARADGFKSKVTAFGDPNAYSLYEFARLLPADMKLVIAHTGAGTLWTDLDKALSGQLGGLKILQKQNK